VLDFRILGPLEVDDGTRLLPLGGRRERALLGMLLLHSGEVVSTDRLLDELWGERPPKTAGASLQNAVSQLRRLLGPDRLLTRPPGYVLEVEAEELDLARFERLVAQARGAEPEQRARQLREALALWRGSPLADLAFETFAQAEIARLDELRWAALEERIEAEVELGQAAELVAELESLVDRQPLRERLRGQLMLALYRSGRQAEALQVYHEARRVLVDELGIDPSRSLQDLYGAILRQEVRLEPAGRAHADADHYAEVAKAWLGGRLVVVLGSDANTDAGGERAETRLPAGVEVAAHLARSFDCPPEHDGELARVAQYVVLMKGIGPLYDELHSLFGVDYAPGEVHRALAREARRLGEAGRPRQLIVTTNFDEALERAFRAEGEPFDVVSYIASGRDRGKFLHRAPDGTATVVDVPNAYAELVPEERTVILKIHGQADPSPGREWDSFVVSEDDYISYLARGEMAAVVPVTLAAKLRRSHFLFLGYGLREWNLRVFLQRVWGDERVAYRSWAVQPDPSPIEIQFWRARGVDVFDVPLEEYVAELGRRLAPELAEAVSP
jgi:DNA-binding SARP family transcriptional activator